MKKFRYIFLPLSYLYSAVVALRNWLYDINFLKSSSFNFPLVCVGNLATGGTGKTPMTEYLVDLLRSRFETATLSRGYKRKTRGFAIATGHTTAIEIGDEPMQFHQKFPDVTVAVGEERLVAIPQILHDRPGTQVIILDDAFQHRAVKAGKNILLTDYHNIYVYDQVLPAGDLRDLRSSSKRADIIIVTKCIPNLALKDRARIIDDLKPLSHQKVFFTEIIYAQPYHLYTKAIGNFGINTEVLLICGIANPKPLWQFVEGHSRLVELIRYPDHHIFSSQDLNEIKAKFEKLPASDKIMLTTEKDAVRLEKFKQELESFPIYVMPIKHSFLFGETDSFNKEILDYVGSFAAAGIHAPAL